MVEGKGPVVDLMLAVLSGILEHLPYSPVNCVVCRVQPSQAHKREQQRATRERFWNPEVGSHFQERVMFRNKS